MNIGIKPTQTRTTRWRARNAWRLSHRSSRQVPLNLVDIEIGFETMDSAVVRGKPPAGNALFTVLNSLQLLMISPGPTCSSPRGGKRKGHLSANISSVGRPHTQVKVQRLCFSFPLGIKYDRREPAHRPGS
jgi:hypothetical protein